jgi:hypothetical protein
LRIKCEGADEMKIIENLLNISGGDGDFIQGGVSTPLDSTEIDQILGAWSEERGRSIERLLLLGRVGRLLSRMLAAGRSTDEDEREMKKLLHLIDSMGGDAPAIRG